METKTTSSGISFSTVLFIIFLVLKLTNVIDWSWWWIFSPIWIPIAIIILCYSFIIFISLISPVFRQGIAKQIRKNEAKKKIESGQFMLKDMIDAEII